MKRWLCKVSSCVICIVLGADFVIAGDSLYGRIAEVKSATLIVQDYEAGMYEFRLVGVGLPTNDALVNEAHQFVSELILDKYVRTQYEGLNETGEMLARLFFENLALEIKDLGEELVREGLVYRLDGFDYPHRELIVAEKNAQSALRGIWAPEKPSGDRVGSVDSETGNQEKLENAEHVLVNEAGAVVNADTSMNGHLPSIAPRSIPVQTRHAQSVQQTAVKDTLEGLANLQSEQDVNSVSDIEKKPITIDYASESIKTKSQVLKLSVGKSFTGRVASITANCHLIVDGQFNQSEIQVYGIEVASNPALNEQARQLISKLALKQQVRVLIENTYRRNEIAASFQFIGRDTETKNLGVELVRAGLARWIGQEDRFVEAFEIAEREAVIERRGIWAHDPGSGKSKR